MMSSDFPHAVMLRDGGMAKCYAEGGLAQAAQQIAGAGRGGDDWVIHINDQELEELTRLWGEPTINPETGMPEFFLKGLRDWFKENEWAGYALPIATGVLAPGLGGTIGGAVNSGLGLGLSEGVQGAIGNGLLGAGMGALTGGGKGALIGGLLGAGTGYLTAGSNGIFGGGGSDVIKGGEGSDSLAPGTGLSSNTQANAGNSSGSGLSSIFNAKNALPIMLAAGALSGLGGGGGSKDREPNTVKSPEHQQMQARMTKPLSQVDFKRTRAPMTNFDPRSYGYGPQRQFFKNNKIPDMPEYADGGEVDMSALGIMKRILTPKTIHSYYAEDERQRRNAEQEQRMQREPRRDYAGGGEVEGMHQMPDGSMMPNDEMPGLTAMANQRPSRYVKGPGTGRSDEIPALLSDSEYVIDAETVSLLGDGSPEAGAKALDQLRENVRRHKGKALSKGKISPDAKPALAYLGGH